ncbi:MAG: hypothetical protein JWQ02_3197, partial [Capsulimonas sp.]|nr:hypothetical protein [Capsulimonas sp.]
LYSVNLDTMRSRHLLYSDGAVSSYLTNYKGTVYGAFHRFQHLTPLQKPAYSQIAIRNGVIRRQRNLSSSSVCYGHSKTSNREAYLNLAGNVLTIRVCESGRQIAEHYRSVAPNR